ncbi:fanconi-associated nuclease 1 isoform X1, partial [Brachionus plicatilis]
MSQTKKYLKLKEIKDEIGPLCAREKYNFTEAPTVDIQGTLLHTSEFIPGRKNVFIDSPSKNGMTISVEQVALNHYINVLGYTHGKHAETTTLTTLYAILFWEIIWTNSVYNVFVDTFQHAPLDLQTKDFYRNRKEIIDNRLKLFSSSSIEDICRMASDCWNSNYGYQCYGVNFELFESLEEFLSLLKCFRPQQLVNLCEYISKNYRYCRSGGPDLVIWSDETDMVKFVEVKGPGDHLSYKQMIWLDFMVKNSI